MLTLQIPKNASVGDIEELLGVIEREPLATELRLRVGSTSTGGMLADVWTAILVGTAARQCPLDLVAWGLQTRITPASAIATTLPFLAGLSLARRVTNDTGELLGTAAARRFYVTRRRGIVDPDSGVEQTLVEFDPDHSIASILRGREGFEPVAPRLRARLFEQLILRFRRKLEIGALRRGIDPVGMGPAGDLGRFLVELHDNGLEHGARDREGRVQSGTRFLRIRKHVANTRTQLLQRAGSSAELRQYIETSFAADQTPALIEASISDFGLGIVDSFAASAAAQGVDLPRATMLDALMYDRLTSKAGDPSAGLGIQKALAAAARMQAFVSLRTGEFWKVAMFTGPSSATRLEDVPGGPHSKVAGTHWQILWMQP